MNKGFIFVPPLMVASGFIGYFIAKKKYQKLADAEIEDVKKKLTEYYKGTNSTEVAAKCEKEKEVITQVSSIEKNQPTEEQYFNYAKQYMSPDVEKKVEARDEASKKEKKGTSEPYIISVEEYENSNYIAKTLFYYIEDKVLRDSDGRCLDLPDELIGSQAMEELKKKTSDVIYVRNERLEADFEIILVDKSMYNESSKNRVIPEEYEQ